ncbi:MAG: rhodanese-like domain-containing protein, partial [Sneathiella sp.]
KMQKQPLRHGFQKMLAEANAVIETVSVQDLPYLLDDPTVILVDVREAVERDSDGGIPGSVHASRGLLEFQADPESPAYNPAMKPDKRLVLYCGSGGRSALAAKTLLDMGYEDVLSLAGGYAAWKVAQGGQ